jgi:ribokinase
MAGRVLVVGSINVDLVVDAARLPAAGETILGGSFGQHQGGKGANQAVAAARAGAAVSMVGAVGEDVLGAEAKAALAAEGIDIDGVVTRPAPTGVALIVVDAAGENQIVVASGANALITPEDLPADALETADIVLTGFEVPLPTVEAAVRRAREVGITVIVNAAPAMALPAALEASRVILVLNEHELTAVSGVGPAGGAPEVLAARIGGPVVVTRGDAGAILARGTEQTPIPGFAAEAVVDTTGAGDAFTGVLAAWLAAGRPLEEAILAGMAAGSLSVGHAGAREGMPTRSRLSAFLAAHPR